MKRSIAASTLALTMALTLASCGTSGQNSTSPSTAAPTTGTALVLSDSGVTLDGQAVTSETDGAVTVSHDIIYYQADMGEDYGAGSSSDEHSQSEADAHTVVTIRQAGTYQVSGSLSAGQLAIDLGSDAKRDPDAVVTLILDNVDITCTVAPAVIFYNVYECDTDWVAYDEEETTDYQSSPTVDTSAAGANVVLADGSVNNIDGSYVAKIYKEGTTKKLYKFDGAFYSKMSMNIDGQTEGTGVLNITAANEGLDSELHLTIHGGNINIQSQDDGINTNEDGVSVTTVKGGTLQINAGLGTEGDGIDSNGYLVIEGGTVYTMSSDHSGDGGIDADNDILLNGGTLVALGVRNDAVSSDSGQEYMELSFASTLPAGSQVELTDPDGLVLLSYTTQKACQSITFSAPALDKDTAYTLTVDGVVQQYTGNSSGGFGGGGRGGMGGGQGDRPNGGDFQPDGQAPSEQPDDQRPNDDGQTPPEKPDGQRPSDDGKTPPEQSDGQRPSDDGKTPPEQSDGQRPSDDGKTPPEQTDGQPPELPDDQQGGGSDDRKRPGGGDFDGGQSPSSGEGSTEFVLSDNVHAFSGISDSAQDSGKTAVTFSAQVSVGEDGTVTVTDIQASQSVEDSHVQLSVCDVPSENYAASCLLSDGDAALTEILPTEPGSYRLTIAVTGDETYTGASQFNFTIPETEPEA